MTDPTPYFQSLLSAAASALTVAGVPASTVLLAPGSNIAWDDCCNGTLYLLVNRVYPTAGADSPFPMMESTAPGAAPGTCPRMMAWRMTLGLLRCAATMDSQGNPPSAAQIGANGAAQGRDIDLLMQTILCTYPTLPGIRKVKIDTWTPLVTDGACTGGEWTFFAGVDPCQCEVPVG